MQLRVAICEDDRLICKDTQRRILELRPEYEISAYDTGEELLLTNGAFDLIFLDIELPGKDGMRIARELRERKYAGLIIFLTSHMEFMQEAFKVRAFRFLNKPIQMEGLDETLTEAEKEIFADKRMILTDYGVKILISVSDILFIESRKNKTIIHTLHEVLETNETLKHWLQELGNTGFLQVHKSYVISLRYIKMFETDFVTLHDTQIRIPVSRRNAGMVKKAFFDYVRANAKYM